MEPPMLPSRDGQQSARDVVLPEREATAGNRVRESGAKAVRLWTSFFQSQQHLQPLCAPMLLRLPCRTAVAPAVITRAPPFAWIHQRAAQAQHFERQLQHMRDHVETSLARVHGRLDMVRACPAVSEDSRDDVRRGGSAHSRWTPPVQSMQNATVRLRRWKVTRCQSLLRRWRAVLTTYGSRTASGARCARHNSPQVVFARHAT